LELLPKEIKELSVEGKVTYPLGSPVRFKGNSGESGHYIYLGLLTKILSLEHLA
jgi:hypothetical protein